MNAPGDRVRLNITTREEIASPSRGWLIITVARWTGTFVTNKCSDVYSPKNRATTLAGGVNVLEVRVFSPAYPGTDEGAPDVLLIVSPEQKQRVVEMG